MHSLSLFGGGRSGNCAPGGSAERRQQVVDSSRWYTTLKNKGVLASGVKRFFPITVSESDARQRHPEGSYSIIALSVTGDGNASRSRV